MAISGLLTLPSRFHVPTWLCHQTLHESQSSFQLELSSEGLCIWSLFHALHVSVAGTGRLAGLARVGPDLADGACAVQPVPLPLQADGRSSSRTVGCSCHPVQLAALPRAKALSNGGSGTQVRLSSAGAGREGTGLPGLLSPTPWFLRVGGLPMLLLCRGAEVAP